MKLTTILTLGAVVLATPALAAATNNGAPGSTANLPTPSQSAMNNSSASGNSSNGSGEASIVSAVPDTKKSYKNSSRASDFRKEADTTKQLNQQVANANNGGSTQQQ